MLRASVLFLLACQPATDAEDTGEAGTNAAPSAPGISLPPSPTAGVDDIACSVDTPSSDADGDAITYHFDWTVDGSAWSGDTAETFESGDTIAASDTIAGQVWSCTVIPDDGTETGSTAQASTTVQAYTCEPTDPLANCHGVNDSDTFHDPSYMGGWPLAIRQVAATPVDIQRVEVWTGDLRVSNRVEIWSNDGDAPGGELGGANFTVAETPAWQGASFATPVSIDAGETYWVVWWTAQGQQASLLPADTGTDVEYRISQDDGLTWGSLFTNPWKLKLFCCEPPS